MARNKDIPEINASAMADIAFLLLTFFLVATTLNKPVGFYEKLPDPDEVQEAAPVELEERNRLIISIDNNNTIRIRDRVVSISEIKPEVMKFVDNGGGSGCDYCSGKRAAEYSSHPANAVIQMLRTKNSTLEPKYAVVGEVNAAYEELRDAYAQKTYNRSYRSIREYEKKSKNTDFEADPEIIAMYTDIEQKYPIKFSKPDPKETL